MSRLKNLCDQVLVFKTKFLRRTVDQNSGGDGPHRVCSTYNSEVLRVVLVSLVLSLWSTQGAGGIPLTRKLCYAVGGVPYQMTNVALGFSLQIFLLDVVQVTTATTLRLVCSGNRNPVSNDTSMVHR